MTSHRAVFRSSAVIGGSSLINIVIGTAKVKVLALLLGPAGIGLMGFYLNIMNMTATLAGCGTGSSGVRQIATSRDQAKTLSAVRRALWIGSLMLGLTGMVALWLTREPVAVWIFGNVTHASSVGWLGLGVLLTQIAGSQTALLQGLRRIGDLAKVSVLSAIVAAVTGIVAVHFLGEDGVLWFVLSAPAVNFVVAGYYTAQLPAPQKEYEFAEIRQQWLALLKLGLPLMAAGLLTLITQLVVRSMVLGELGLDASGYFHAAWTISMTYVTFVLNAMAMEYFPRLTAAINDPNQARRLVNEQTEMALLLAGPLLIAMMTLAPWVIHLLYSDSFGAASEVLRWQVLGDILKIATVPIVFIFLALGNGSIAVTVQCVWCTVYLGVVALGIGEYGLLITGVGFAAAYLIYFMVVALFANQLIGHKPSKRNSLLLCVLLLLGVILVFIAPQTGYPALSIGAAATTFVSLYSLYRLDHLMDLRGWLRQRMS